jgi:hypothetical protein
LQRQFSKLGGRGPVCRLQKQLSTNQVLKPLDLRTYSGLAEAQSLARFRQATGLRNGNYGANDFDRYVLKLVPSMHQKPLLAGQGQWVHTIPKVKGKTA